MIDFCYGRFASSLCKRLAFGCQSSAPSLLLPAPLLRFPGLHSSLGHLLRLLGSEGRETNLSWLFLGKSARLALVCRAPPPFLLTSLKKKLCVHVCRGVAVVRRGMNKFVVVEVYLLSFVFLKPVQLGRLLTVVELFL